MQLSMKAVSILALFVMVFGVAVPVALLHFHSNLLESRFIALQFIAWPASVFLWSDRNSIGAVGLSVGLNIGMYLALGIVMVKHIRSWNSLLIYMVFVVSVFSFLEYFSNLFLGYLMIGLSYGGLHAGIAGLSYIALNRERGRSTGVG